MELGVYFEVDTGEDIYTIAGDWKSREGLRWLLLDYPKARVRIMSKADYTPYYDWQPLSKIARLPVLDTTSRLARKQWIAELENAVG